MRRERERGGECREVCGEEVVGGRGVGRRKVYWEEELREEGEGEC